MNHTVYLFCCMVLTVSIYLLNNLKNLKYVGIMHIKIFGYKLHESVKILICLMQRLDFRKLYDLRRLMFITKLSQTKHDIICSLLPLFQSFEDNYVLFHTYDLTVHSNQGAIKFAVFSHSEKYVLVNMLY